MPATSRRCCFRRDAHRPFSSHMRSREVCSARSCVPPPARLARGVSDDVSHQWPPRTPLDQRVHVCVATTNLPKPRFRFSHRSCLRMKLFVSIAARVAISSGTCCDTGVLCSEAVRIACISKLYLVPLWFGLVPNPTEIDVCIVVACEPLKSRCIVCMCAWLRGRGNVPVSVLEPSSAITTSICLAELCYAVEVMRNK